MKQYLLTWKNEAGFSDNQIVHSIQELVELVESLTDKKCYSFEVYHVLPNE